MIGRAFAVKVENHSTLLHRFQIRSAKVLAKIALEADEDCGLLAWKARTLKDGIEWLIRRDTGLRVRGNTCWINLNANDSLSFGSSDHRGSNALVKVQCQKNVEIWLELLDSVLVCHCV